jgi:spore maturation protein CgeB
MYEIPACGAFMLAERNQENVNVFEEGIDAVFFSSQKELLEKVRYYLENNQERNSIASKGRVRCLASGYSYQSRLKEMIRKVEELEN